MKFFENKKVENREVEKPKVDNSAFIKNNLMKSVDRSTEVRKAVEEWLFSFDGAITKATFAHQIRRLDWDDEKALEQLERAKGRRTIPLPPPPKLPKLEGKLLEKMVEHNYVAVVGRGAFKEELENAEKRLKEFGTVYVLSIEELIVEFKGYYEKGNSPHMIERAIETDFLIIMDLQMPIHLEWHIREAIERIGRMREERERPIISTWNRFNDVNEFFKRFRMYQV